MKLSEGRATSAPTLDSLVQALYSNGVVDSVGQSHGDKRRVPLDTTVLYRPIPSEGRGRRTPARGSRSTDGSGRGLDTVKEELHQGIDECMIDRVDECICGGLCSRARARWGDWDGDPECLACARSWSLTQPATAPRVSLAHSSNFVPSDCRLGFRRTCNRLSGGHLEGSRPLPTSGGRPKFDCSENQPTSQSWERRRLRFAKASQEDRWRWPQSLWQWLALHSHMRSRVRREAKCACKHVYI